MEQNSYQPQPQKNQIEGQLKPAKPWLKIALLSFLGVFLAGGLVFAGYKLGEKRLASNLVSLTPIPTIVTSTPAFCLSPTPIPLSTIVATLTSTMVTPTVDLTANWKIYNSEIISFKYPTNLTLQERQKNYIVLLSDPNNPLSVAVSIDARLISNYADYDKAITSTKAGLTEIQTQEIKNGIKISGKIGSGFGAGQQINIALFKYQQGAIEAETTTTDPAQLHIFDQILSTFKFLD